MTLYQYENKNLKLNQIFSTNNGQHFIFSTAEDCEIEEANNFTIAQEIEKLSKSFTAMKCQVESLADEMATMKGSIEATTGKKTNHIIIHIQI